MIFTELRFFFFFAIVMALFWTLRNYRLRKLMLLAASYVFYGAWDYRFLGLIVLSTTMDFFVARAISRTDRTAARRLLLTVSVVVNLGILGTFKYCDFFISSAVDLFHTLGVPWQPGLLHLVLPVGISFYTFQTLSYTIDVYRRQMEPTRNPFDYALFVAFFPQLVAGPIVRAADFVPQLKAPPRFADIDWRPLVSLFMIGFFKKAVISDNIAPMVDAYFNAPELYDVPSAFLGVFLYATQIYCDFSGYSDMAIAAAGMLGYKLCLNFDHPYFATNVTDFWRRWHISLSTFLRDYLYIPLGGNRKGEGRTHVNLMTTMLLGGLWHGAAWTFIVWGALHGGALVGHKLFRKAIGRDRSHTPSTVGLLLGWTITFYWVCLAWIFFRAATFEDAWTVVKAYCGFTASGTQTLVAARPMVLLAVVFALHWLNYKRVGAGWYRRLPEPIYAAGAGVAMALLLSLMRVDYAPFIYFQF